MPQPKSPAATSDKAVGKYVVTCAGVSYEAPGDPGPISLAVHGRVISLHDDEAERLLRLDAIKFAEDDDLAREAVHEEREAEAARASGPVDNPYGGSLRGVDSLQAHADAVKKQIAEAHKAAKA